MNHILGELVGEKCLVYIDDIIVFGKTLDEHVNNLDVVLERLEKYHFYIKPKKCKIGFRKINFMGFVVSQEGIEMDQSKVEAIQRITRPRNKKELQRFLGMLNYYRRFIEKFAWKTFHLRKLLKKDTFRTERDWDERCEEEFNVMKKELMGDRIMAYPDTLKPFILETDASKLGLSAVLIQEHEGKERVVEYASRSLTQAEGNIQSASELEMCAIKWGVTEKFRCYLTNPFTIRTDHKALEKHYNVGEASPKLLRWILKLSPYNFVIEYRKGADNHTADFLSRMYLVTEEKIKGYKEKM